MLSSSGLPITIDCHYIFSKFAAAFLIHENHQAIFIENNTSRAVPYLLEALQRSQLSPQDVQYLIVTHVHLDHSSGSSLLMKLCPQAILLAHPRAAPHLVDPSRLTKSAKLVYGEEIFERIYGSIDPINPSRIKVMQDGEELFWNSRKLNFLHTRGHANHHFCIYDSQSEGVFTGDTFGLAYPALQRNGLFIFPSTSPTDFDPQLARESIHRILQMKPKRAYLTHFGEITQLEQASAQLIEHLDFSEWLVEQCQKSYLSDDELKDFCEKELKAYFQAKLDWIGLGNDSDIWELLQPDISLNAMGVSHLAKKRRHQVLN